MSEINNGGPAFPTLGDEFMQTGDGTWHAKSEYGFQGQPGMSLRDYFAGQAMAAYNANPSAWDNPSHDRAKWAVEDADALLAALSGQKPKSIDESPHCSDINSQLVALLTGIKASLGTAEWGCPADAEAILQELIDTFHPKLGTALAKATGSAVQA